MKVLDGLINKYKSWAKYPEKYTAKEVLHQINRDLDWLKDESVSENAVLPDVIRRYFVVVYRAFNGRAMLDGQINMDTNGTYIERKKALEIIKDNNKDFEGVIITNLIELTKEEYACWMG